MQRLHVKAIFIHATRDFERVQLTKQICENAEISENIQHCFLQLFFFLQNDQRKRLNDLQQVMKHGLFMKILFHTILSFFSAVSSR